MPEFNFLQEIYNNFSARSDRNAFYIKGRFYTYGELSAMVASIQDELERRAAGNLCIGVVLNDDLETYASILAIWMSGHTFIPVNPGFPPERNRNIAEQVGLKLLLYSKSDGIDTALLSSIVAIETLNLTAKYTDLPKFKRADPEDDLYILFTSGSTGIPKGVRLSVSNLNAFIRDFIAYPEYDFAPDDRFLQIYDLSFDASIHCYVVPLVLGACVYTVPQDEIKYLAAFKLMKEQQLTFVKMPPSTLSYLKPYFASINLPDLKYCLLGGEALPVTLAKEWEPCVPNALIQNVYGPTEVTINCLIYDWNGMHGTRKDHQGTVSIGKQFGSNKSIVVNDNMKSIKPWEEGELLMAGDQVSPGYLDNEAMNASAFVEVKTGDEQVRYYRSGDIVTMDEDGDIMYLNRRDEQVQVQGYRVEMGEIEQMARQCLEGKNVVAMGKADPAGQMRIYLLVESDDIDQQPLMQYLSNKLPHYMIPAESILLDEFPKLVSGKLDRKALYEMLPDE